MRWLVVALLCSSSLGALAQPEPTLNEVVPRETIELRIGQTRTFRFDQSATQITLANKGVAELIPETDKEFNLRGLDQGQTTLTAYGQGGRIIYRAAITVLPAGGYVKVYGHGGRDKDFTSYFCGEYGCGRADSDVAPVPFSTTQSESQTRPDGVQSTVSREYRAPRR